MFDLSYQGAKTWTISKSLIGTISFGQITLLQDQKVLQINCTEWKIYGGVIDQNQVEHQDPNEVRLKATRKVTSYLD
ncbi:hypothetical protein RUM43_002737 [Polyplax serrata]|uniref:Uncharacterized protein n=1 Tax=Polyplax serrata TaxID=468196 RepID=A0AAN8NV79_POLSC